MKKRIWIGTLLTMLALTSALWVFGSYMIQPSEAGFRIYLIENNTILISDADILSYNWTNQEMAITPEASERLTEMGGLYSWTGFVIRIDGKEIYAAYSELMTCQQHQLLQESVYCSLLRFPHLSR